jgi:flagellar operon protein
VSIELNPALLPPALGPTQPGAQGQRPAPAGAATQVQPGPSFAEALKDASAAREQGEPAQPGSAQPAAAGTAAEAAGTSGLRFSKHAVERAQRRGIPLDPVTLGRLQEGVGRIAGKGARDSLVLVDGTAFVVSVPNRTVITAVGSEHMREHVFTNIDSAVIA